MVFKRVHTREKTQRIIKKQVHDPPSAESRERTYMRQAMRMIPSDHRVQVSMARLWTKSGIFDYQFSSGTAREKERGGGERRTGEDDDDGMGWRKGREVKWAVELYEDPRSCLSFTFLVSNNPPPDLFHGQKPVKNKKRVTRAEKGVVAKINTINGLTLNRTVGGYVQKKEQEKNKEFCSCVVVLLQFFLSFFFATYSLSHACTWILMSVVLK